MSSKFHNIKTYKDGVTFASKREANRYEELKLRLYAGEIQNLRLQPRYDLIVNEVKICTYVGDFLYNEKGRDILEDVKSKATRTPAYILKKKLMKAVLGIDIVEV